MGIRGAFLKKALNNHSIQKRNKAKDIANNKMMELSANHPIHQTGHVLYLRQILREQGIKI